MFGEDLLIGHKNVGIDEKNRIYLPPFTKAEENDVLALVNGVDHVGNPQIKLYLLKNIEKLQKNYKNYKKTRHLLMNIYVMKKK